MTVDGGSRRSRTPEQRVAPNFIVLVLGVLLIGGCSQANYASWFIRTIPAKIEISEPIAVAYEGLLESCGVAVYHVKHEIVERIDTEGLRFFDDATTGRGDETIVYARWRSTPPDLPLEEPGGGIDLLNGLSCAHQNFPRELLSTIYKSIERAGSFYTTKHEASLFLFPRLELVVFIHDG